jgi:hypothetical protein
MATKEVFDASTDEDLVLEHLGYEQGRRKLLLISKFLH